MKKSVLILSLLISANLFAQQRMDSQKFYDAIVTRDAKGLNAMLMLSPETVTLEPAKAIIALGYIKKYWCSSEDADVNLIQEATKLLAANLDEEQKTQFMQKFLPWYESHKSEALLEMGRAITSQMSVGTSFFGYLRDFLDDGLVTQEQLLTEVNARIDKAEKETNRAEVNSLLGQAECLSIFFDKKTEGVVDDKIAVVEGEQLAKDKELLTVRINKYFKEKNTDYNATVYKMVKQILETKDLMQNTPDGTLLAEIILGKRERDFQDGLVARLEDLPKISKLLGDVIMLIFLTANDNITYCGKEYTPLELVKSILSYDSIYNVDRFRNVFCMSDHSLGYRFSVMNEIYSLNKVLPDNAFEKFDVMWLECVKNTSY